MNQAELLNRARLGTREVSHECKTMDRRLLVLAENLKIVP